MMLWETTTGMGVQARWHVLSRVSVGVRFQVTRYHGDSRFGRVYARAGVCYACCMAQQFPSDKSAHGQRESSGHASSASATTSAAGAAPSAIISSRDNKWLKKFRAALRGAGPKPGEAIAAEGPKLVEEGVRAGLETEALLVSEAGERQLERILRAASERESGSPRSRIFK